MPCNDSECNKCTMMRTQVMNTITDFLDESDSLIINSGGKTGRQNFETPNLIRAYALSECARRLFDLLISERTGVDARMVP